MYRARFNFDSKVAALALALALAVLFLAAELLHLLPLSVRKVYGDPNGLQISVPVDCHPGEVRWSWLHDHRGIQQASGKIVETGEEIHYIRYTDEYWGAQFTCPLQPGNYTVFAQTDLATVTAPLPVLGPTNSTGNSTGTGNDTGTGNETGTGGNETGAGGGTTNTTPSTNTTFPGLTDWLFYRDPSIYAYLVSLGVPDGLAQLLSMPATWLFFFILILLLTHGSRYTGFLRPGYRSLLRSFRLFAHMRRDA